MANKKILLVEDDSAIIDIYQTMMQKADLAVEVASSGQEVLKKIKNIAAGEAEKPDIILLDLILPDMNGMDILTAIKNNEATKTIKVFILTNQEESKTQIPGTIKPDKFIIKANITPTQLLETI